VFKSKGRSGLPETQGPSEISELVASRSVGKPLSTKVLDDKNDFMAARAPPEHSMARAVFEAVMAAMDDDSEDAAQPREGVLASGGCETYTTPGLQ
jgi:hypothetical protein